MVRDDLLSFLRSEIKKTEQKLQTLAGEKAGADGPRTSWHSQIHLDLEGQIDTHQKYLARCRKALASLEGNQPTGYIGSGSVASLEIGGEVKNYILVEDGGGPIGDCFILSSRSPIGKAVWGKTAAMTVQVPVPAGSVSVKILEVS